MSRWAVPEASTGAPWREGFLLSRWRSFLPWGTLPFLRQLALATAVVCGAGCSALLPKPDAPMVIYALDGSGMAPASAPALPGAARGTLLVQALHAAPGFDSTRIIYTRQPHRIEFYAQSEWVDTPARMLAPLVVAALERSGGFVAVAMAPSTAAGNLRLDVEILQLAHAFTTRPSEVRLTLRATVVASASRRVLATRVIEARAVAGSEDAAGGVLAANQAAQTALQALAEFCSRVADTQALPQGPTAVPRPARPP